MPIKKPTDGELIVMIDTAIENTKNMNSIGWFPFLLLKRLRKRLLHGKPFVAGPSGPHSFFEIEKNTCIANVKFLLAHPEYEETFTGGILTRRLNLKGSAPEHDKALFEHYRYAEDLNGQ